MSAGDAPEKVPSLSEEEAEPKPPAVEIDELNRELGLYHVMFVLDDPNRLDEVLDAWYRAGVRGVTILESTGLFRRRGRALGARYAFGFPRLFGGAYAGHFTLAAIVHGRPAVRRCLKAVEEIVGDLSNPNTGMLAAWPVTYAKGAVDRQAVPLIEEEDA